MSPLYFIEVRSPRIRGPWFLEVDRDSNSRAHVIGLITSGDVEPVKIIEVNEDEGRVRDVTDEILTEVSAQMPPITPSPVERQEWAFDHARDLWKHGAVS
jgi:hypothetical protein